MNKHAEKRKNGSRKWRGSRMYQNHTQDQSRILSLPAPHIHPSPEWLLSQNGFLSQNGYLGDMRQYGLIFSPTPSPNLHFFPSHCHYWSRAPLCIPGSPVTAALLALCFPVCFSHALSPQAPLGCFLPSHLPSTASTF